jgi:hypothetical protein
MVTGCRKPACSNQLGVTGHKSKCGILGRTVFVKQARTKQPNLRMGVKEGDHSVEGIIMNENVIVQYARIASLGVSKDLVVVG